MPTYTHWRASFRTQICLWKHGVYILVCAFPCLVVVPQRRLIPTAAESWQNLLLFLWRHLSLLSLSSRELRGAASFTVILIQCSRSFLRCCFCLNKTAALFSDFVHHLNPSRWILSSKFPLFEDFLSTSDVRFNCFRLNPFWNFNRRYRITFIFNNF